MQAFEYPAHFEKDEDGRVLVTFRDFSCGATDGADRAEATAEAIDFLESALAHIVHQGKDLPLPSPPQTGEVLIGPSAVTAAQVALYEAMRSGNVSPDDLAQRLTIPVSEIHGLTDLSNYPPLEKIERALAVLGHRLTVALEAAE